MEKITDKSKTWLVKFEFLIQRLGALISQEGKKLVLINVEAEENPKKQFDKYMQTVELVRKKVECVVSTSLPGEERIFWPFYDVQFYIREDKEVISTTGNPEIIQRVFNADNQEVDTTIPRMDYWKGKEFVYQLDASAVLIPLSCKSLICLALIPFTKSKSDVSFYQLHNVI